MDWMLHISWNLENLISHEYSSIVFTIIGILLLYLFIRCGLNEEIKDPISEEYMEYELKYDHEKEICNSQDCVRCSKYKEIQSQSLSAIHDYITQNEKNEIERVYDSIKCGPKNNQIFNLEQKPNVLYISGLTALSLWNELNVTGFETEVKELERNYEQIVDEYRNVSLLQSGWTTNNTPEGSWSAFHIYNQGKEILTNSSKCPVVMGLLKGVLQKSFMKNCIFGNVFFSKLEPGTRIGKHYGPCNIRLRCHLGLKVPDGWSITVGDIESSWTEGKCLIFDDSFLHSVSHNFSTNTGSRVVLIIDFWHPGLKPKEIKALVAVYKSD